MTEAERFEALKTKAWHASDLELFEFYNGIEHELKRLRAAGHVVAMFYERGGVNDEGWNTLFEALFDANLLNGDEVCSSPQLRAAAPELLTICEELYRTIPGISGADEIAHEWLKLKDVIAKARGETTE